MKAKRKKGSSHANSPARTLRMQQKRQAAVRGTSSGAAPMPNTINPIALTNSSESMSYEELSGGCPLGTVNPNDLMWESMPTAYGSAQHDGVPLPQSPTWGNRIGNEGNPMPQFVSPRDTTDASMGEGSLARNIDRATYEGMGNHIEHAGGLVAQEEEETMFQELHDVDTALTEGLDVDASRPLEGEGTQDIQKDKYSTQGGQFNHGHNPSFEMNQQAEIRSPIGDMRHDHWPTRYRQYDLRHGGNLSINQDIGVGARGRNVLQDQYPSADMQYYYEYRRNLDMNQQVEARGPAGDMSQDQGPSQYGGDHYRNLNVEQQAQVREALARARLQGQWAPDRRYEHGHNNNLDMNQQAEVRVPAGDVLQNQWSLPYRYDHSSNLNPYQGITDGASTEDVSHDQRQHSQGPNGQDGGSNLGKNQTGTAGELDAIDEWLKEQNGFDVCPKEITSQG